jgi:hypothetical protein
VRVPSPQQPYHTPHHSTATNSLLDKRHCSRLSLFQISAAKAPSDVAFKSQTICPGERLSLRRHCTCHPHHISTLGSLHSALSFIRITPRSLFLLTLASSLFGSSPYILFYFQFFLSYWSGLLSALAARDHTSPYILFNLPTRYPIVRNPSPTLYSTICY